MVEIKTSPLPLVVAITGASGAAYAVRLLELVLENGREVHLMVSPSGAAVLKQELDRTVDIEKFQLQSLLPAIDEQQRIHYHHYQDYFAPVASGSFVTGGMVV